VFGLARRASLQTTVFLFLEFFAAHSRTKIFPGGYGFAFPWVADRLPISTAQRLCRFWFGPSSKFTNHRGPFSRISQRAPGPRSFRMVMVVTLPWVATRLPIWTAPAKKMRSAQQVYKTITAVAVPWIPDRPCGGVCSASQFTPGAVGTVFGVRVVSTVRDCGGDFASGDRLLYLGRSLCLPAGQDDQALEEATDCAREEGSRECKCVSIRSPNVVMYDESVLKRTYRRPFNPLISSNERTVDDGPGSSRRFAVSVVIISTGERNQSDRIGWKRCVRASAVSQRCAHEELTTEKLGIKKKVYQKAGDLVWREMPEQMGAIEAEFIFRTQPQKPGPGRVTVQTEIPQTSVIRNLAQI
jgi:hypothetical protein